MTVKEKIKLILDIIFNRYVAQTESCFKRCEDLVSKLEYAKSMNDELAAQNNILNNLISMKEQERLKDLQFDAIIDNYVNIWEKK